MRSSRRALRRKGGGNRGGRACFERNSEKGRTCLRSTRRVWNSMLRGVLWGMELGKEEALRKMSSLLGEATLALSLPLLECAGERGRGKEKDVLVGEGELEI